MHIYKNTARWLSKIVQKLSHESFVCITGTDFETGGYKTEKVRQ